MSAKDRPFNVNVFYTVDSSSLLNPHGWGGFPGLAAQYAALQQQRVVALHAAQRAEDAQHRLEELQRSEVTWQIDVKGLFVFRQNKSLTNIELKQKMGGNER